MNDRLTEIKREMASLRAKIKPMEEMLQVLSRERRKLESKRFIEVNNITKDQIEMSLGPSKPWFGTYVAFGEWLADNNVTKPWCEWNTMIFRTSDAILGRMDYDARGCVDDL